MASKRKPRRTKRSHNEQTPEKVALGARIAEVRHAKGMKQVDLARAAHVTRGAIWLIEVGRNSPSPALLCRIGEALGVSLGTDDMRPS